MFDGNLVIAYHGCDVTTRDELVSGRLAYLSPSNNDYDWLGPGAYFFEGDAERALRFAQAAAKAPQHRFTAKPIATPAVVGAVLCIRKCLDMTTQLGLYEFEKMYRDLLATLAAEGASVPVNRRAFAKDADVITRKLDNAVFTHLHKARIDLNQPSYEAVRAAFRQGDEIAPLSGFHANSHIQIALRENSCVVGWFLPFGERLLTARALGSARKRLSSVSTTKPRVRIGV